VPFYTTTISKLTETDLLELVMDNAVENLRLEFKSQVPKEDETLKKLSSFANTFGGLMVIGAEAQDGKITSLPGVPSEPGYKQTITNWCFMKFSPPLTVEFSEPIKVASGRYCYVVAVPESDVAPHFINGRKGVWIRTDEFSNRFEAKLADERELRALFDRRKAIRERREFNIRRAQQRFDAHVANMHTDRGGHLGEIGPILELCVTPRFPARQLCPQGELLPHLDQATFDYRGSQFLRHGSKSITAYESVIIRDRLRLPGTSMFSADVWGTCYYATQIFIEMQKIAGADLSGIHRSTVNGFVVAFLLHAAKMLKSLGYFGSLIARLSLKSIRGMRWLYGASSFAGVLDKLGSELDMDISFDLPEISEVFYSDPYGLAARSLERIYFSCNWADIVDSPGKIKSLVDEGFTNCNWPINNPPKP
jgi:schlafen family protein